MESTTFNPKGAGSFDPISQPGGGGGQIPPPPRISPFERRKYYESYSARKRRVSQYERADKDFAIAENQSVV